MKTITVQQLIDSLQKIENKNLVVISTTENEDWSPTREAKICNSAKEFPYMKGSKPNELKSFTGYPIVII